MKRRILILLASATILGCGTPDKKQADKPIVADKAQLTRELVAADSSFSVLSASKGYQEAFLTYAAEDVILMREKDFPIQGKDSLKAFFGRNKSDRKLTWIPSKAEVAASGDLGWTFGVWKVSQKGPDGKERSAEGYYTTFWRKQSDGSWKFTLDAGSSNPQKQ